MIRHREFPTGNTTFPARGVVFHSLGVNIMKSFALIISLSAFVLASLVLASGWISNIVTSHAALSGVMVGFMVAQLFRERS